MWEVPKDLRQIYILLADRTQKSYALSQHSAHTDLARVYRQINILDSECEILFGCLWGSLKILFSHAIGSDGSLLIREGWVAVWRDATSIRRHGQSRKPRDS